MGGHALLPQAPAVLASSKGIMREEPPAALKRRDAWVWTCILAAVAVVAVLGSVIAVYDVRRAVADRREEELRRLKFNAERSAVQIQIQLAESNPPRIEAIRDAQWLREYWQWNLRQQPGRRYATVIDLDGKIVAHSELAREGQQVVLPSQGSGNSLTESMLVESPHDSLAGGFRVLNMQVPIRVHGQTLGTYHSGLDASWLENELAVERWNRTRFWTILVGGTCGIILLSSVAVVRVTRHTARLEHELEAAHTRRVSEMHELVLGIAHEIRNPLNAIRLNLHTLEQVFHDEAALSDDEIAAMLAEMTGEVERLESLMREMLGFARTSGERIEPIDVGAELERTLAFLRPRFDQGHIRAGLDTSLTTCVVAMDRTRLRQVVLNLLNNCCEALNGGGTIEVAVRNLRGQVVITVTDDGPGIAPPERERVFIPFFSTKASGTGLGLALARKFIEEAGGVIACEDHPAGRGCCFRIALPALPAAVPEGVS